MEDCECKPSMYSVHGKSAFKWTAKQLPSFAEIPRDRALQVVYLVSLDNSQQPLLIYYVLYYATGEQEQYWKTFKSYLTTKFHSGNL